jgi:hypothetical protein
MAELKVKDWKPSPCGRFKFARVKKAYATFGEIRKYTSGLTIYWAFRKPDEVFAELDAWAIDIETLAVMKSRAVTHIGVLVTNGDTYLTRIETMFDKDRGAVVLNYSKHMGARGKVGARQWYLPRAAFVQTISPPESTIELMKIRGRR